MLDHLKSFCAALATRGPVRLRVEVNAEAWRTLRAELHRPYKHEPNAGFTLYLDGGAGTVEFVPGQDGGSLRPGSFAEFEMRALATGDSKAREPGDPWL